MHADAFVGIKALATPAPTRQHPCSQRPLSAVRRRCAELRRMPMMLRIVLAAAANGIYLRAASDPSLSSLLGDDDSGARRTPQQQHRVRGRLCRAETKTSLCPGPRLLPCHQSDARPLRGSFVPWLRKRSRTPSANRLLKAAPPFAQPWTRPVFA